MDSALTGSRIAALRKDFAANTSHKAVQNALARTAMRDVAIDHRIAVGIDSSMSHQLDDWKVTNQKRSGRCWMFAGLNLLRPGTAQALNLKDFEFSQNYILFFDKLERANYLLESVIDFADVDIDDRTLAQILHTAAEDGGQWNMFVALVRKHGLVPKSVMPETHSSSNTGEMNSTLRGLLREAALRLRSQAAAGADSVALRESKDEIIETVYRVLSLHLGTVPETFDWQWRDQDNAFRRDGELTPRQFTEKYVTLPLDEYVCLVHDPRHEYGRTYTVDGLGNVVDAPGVVYLNVDIEVIRRAAADTIVSGEPVWFGCDVAPHMQRELGIWDAALIDYQSTYGFTPSMTKKDRLLSRETEMTHAMLFTGVNLVDSRPTRWRVENSWGDEVGLSGYFTMTDSWFSEYVFEIAAHRSFLSEEVLEGLKSDPIALPAWDPMGSLAR